MPRFLSLERVCFIWSAYPFHRLGHTIDKFGRSATIVCLDVRWLREDYEPLKGSGWWINLYLSSTCFPCYKTANELCDIIVSMEILVKCCVYHVSFCHICFVSERREEHNWAEIVIIIHGFWISDTCSRARASVLTWIPSVFRRKQIRHTIVSHRFCITIWSCRAFRSMYHIRLCCASWALNNNWTAPKRSVHKHA